MLSLVSTQKIFTSEQLSALIKRERLARGLSQLQLAEHANLSRTAVQRIERGEGTFEVETALKLLHILSLDLAVLSRGPQTREVQDAR